MTITIRHSGLRSTYRSDARIENEILGLQTMLKIEEARVLLARNAEGGPAYKVHVELVTPGPDLRVEGSDQTLEAAMRKAITGLRRLITAKRSSRLARVKNKRQSEHPQHARRAVSLGV